MHLTSELPVCHVRLADLSLADDQAVVLRLLNHYAEEPFGMGKSLPKSVQDRLIDGLRRHPMSRIFIADVPDGQAVALAVCFVGFSTFYALPLLNIHDLVVHESTRGAGVGTRLLDAIVEYARQQGYCSVTLEVKHDNPARELYARTGFQNLRETESGGLMLFGKLHLTNETS